MQQSNILNLDFVQGFSEREGKRSALLLRLLVRYALRRERERRRKKAK